VSPKIRLLALVGFGVALALGAGMLLLGKKQSSSSAAALPTVHPLYPNKHHARTHAPIARTHVKKAVAAETKPALARHKAKRAHRMPAVVNGMPAALAASLSSHQVVVVALYAPHSHVDDLAYAEARAGAASAGAGFVALNVLNERASHALTDVLAGAQAPSDRILDDPAVLVFQQPKTLFVRLNGFVDRDTVAQAAQNAVPLTASQ
jgi:hypothetical protein